MTPQVPDDLNWIAIRSACTLTVIFEKLTLEIKQDVEQINNLGPKKFECIRDGAYISVFQLNRLAGQRGITIRCTDKAITASGSNKAQSVEATIKMTDDGKCSLCVDGKEKRLWQFRKDILEHLFFGNDSFF